MPVNEAHAKLVLDTKEAEAKVRQIENDIKAVSKDKIKVDADLTKAIDDLNKTKSKIAEIRKEIESLGNKKLSLKASHEEFQRISKEINNIDRQLNQLGAKRLKLQGGKEEIDRLNAEIKKLESKKAEIKVNTTDLAEAEQKIRQINEQIAQIKSERSAKLGSLGFDASGYDKLKNTIKDISMSMKELRNKKGALNLDLKDLKEAEKMYQQITKQIDNLQAKEGKIKVDDSEVKKLQEDSERLKSLMSQLTSQRAKAQVDAEQVREAENRVSNLKRLMDSVNHTTMKVKAVGQGIENVGKSMFNMFSVNSNNPLGKLSHFLVQGVGYSALYRGVSSVMNAVEDVFAGSIERWDVMTAANRTFHNMGLDDSTIDTGMKDLRASIHGLPTSLNDATSQTVKLTAAMNNDMPKAVKLFSALNNSILTFGGTTDNVNKAVTQFAQSMGNGSINGQTFRSLTDNMMTPALTKLAEHFEMDIGTFKEALSSGQISIEDFTDALIELNEVGMGGYKPLSEMAKDSVKTVGGATSVVKTMIQDGLVQIYDSASKVLQDLSNDPDKSVYRIIMDMGEKIQEGLYNVATWITDHKEEIGNGIEFIKEKIDALSETLGKFDWESFLDGIKDFEPVFNIAKEGLKGAFDTIKDIMTFIGGGDASKGLGRAVTGWYTIAGGLMFLGKALQVLSPVIGVGKGLAKLVGLKLPGGGLFDKIKGIFGGKGGDAAGGGKGLTNMDSFKSNLLDIGTNFVKMAALAGEIMLFAEAIKQLDEKMPENPGTLVPKFAALAGVMAGMQLLTTASGWITEHFGLQDEMLTGMLTMIAEGGTLWLLAQAIGEFDKKVPPINEEGVLAKMGTVAAVVGEMSVLAGVIGGIEVATGGIAALAEGAGLTTIVAIAGTLSKMAEAMGTLNKTEIDDSILDKVDTLIAITEKMSSNDFFGAVGEWISGSLEASNMKKAADSMSYMATMMNSLNDVQSVEINVDDVTSKIGTIKNDIIPLFNNFELPDVKQLDETKIQSVSNGIKSISKIGKAAQNFVKGMENITLDKDAITEKVKEVSEVLGAINATYLTYNLRNFPKEDKFTNALSGINKMKDIATKLMELQQYVSSTFKAEDVKKAVGDVLDAVNQIMMKMNNTEDGGFGATMKTYGKGENITNAYNAVDKLNQIINKLKKFTPDSFDIDGVLTSIDNVQKAIDGIAKITAKEGENVAKIEGIVNAFNDLLTALNGLSESFFSTGSELGDAIIGGFLEADISAGFSSEVDGAITALGKKNSEFKAVGKTYGEKVKEGFGEGLKNIESKLSGISSSLSTYNQSFYNAGVTLGQQLAAGIESGASNATVSINVKASLSTGRTGGLNSVFGDIPFNGISINKSMGGIIPKYYANGGLAYFEPKGTDTVPAMLTPGEFVIKRKTVRKYGKEFFNRLNNMDVHGAISALTHRYNTNETVNNSVTNITNNVYNNDNRKIEINGHSRGERESMVKADRWMRALA